MRHIEVQFQDGSHAFVDDFSLEDLIQSRRIKEFYRPSEMRWIVVAGGAIRKSQGGYQGLERRKMGSIQAMIPSFQGCSSFPCERGL
jgi:hypothetical protein